MITTPANDHLMITSSDLIQEVLDTPDDVLSLHAIAKEVCYDLDPLFMHEESSY